MRLRRFGRTYERGKSTVSRGRSRSARGGEGGERSGEHTTHMIAALFLVLACAA